MRWIYRSKYAGPDRRSGGFVVRLFERRRDDGGETRSPSGNALEEFFSCGLRWVDHFNYFGPDRRGNDFSFFFFERRRTKSVGNPPPLHTALRQLRVSADDAAGQDALRERLMATALLAHAQGFSAVANSLITLARNLQSFNGASDPRPELLGELKRVESMLV